MRARGTTDSSPAPHSAQHLRYSATARVQKSVGLPLVAAKVTLSSPSRACGACPLCGICRP
eukprot:6206575-Pleurochrysis_carterae.AAC.2